MTTRVLIADDEAIVRHGLTMILGAAEDIEVVGEAADGHQAALAAERLRPDVALMDVRMPVLDGIEATRRVTALGSHVLILTTYDVDENLYLAVKAGAEGFLLKTSSPEDLVHAVRTVARGDALVGPALTSRLLEAYARRPPQSLVPQGALAKLTERERDVLRLMATGRSNAEIGEVLHVSEGTVKTHVAAVLAKLRTRDRLQAVVHAYETGFVVPGRPPR